MFSKSDLVTVRLMGGWDLDVQKAIMTLFYLMHGFPGACHRKREHM